jgi:hypothetical protein
MKILIFRFNFLDRKISFHYSIERQCHLDQPRIIDFLSLAFRNEDKFDRRASNNASTIASVQQAVSFESANLGRSRLFKEAGCEPVRDTRMAGMGSGLLSMDPIELPEAAKRLPKKQECRLRNPQILSYFLPVISANFLLEPPYKDRFWN